MNLNSLAAPKITGTEGIVYQAREHITTPENNHLVNESIVIDVGVFLIAYTPLAILILQSSLA